MLDSLREYIRPMSVLALICTLLGGALVSGVMEALVPGAGLRFTAAVSGWFSAIPESYYTMTTAFGLAYIGARGAEKWKQIDSDKQTAVARIDQIGEGD